MRTERAAGATRTGFPRFVSLLGACLLSAGAGIATVHAAPDRDLDLSRLPLLVNATIPPNILISLDDSGSMGWGYLPDGANYGASDCRYYNSAYNRIYFDPNATYTPPLKPDGTQFDNASWPHAWIDGFRPDLGTINLSTNYRVSNDHQNSPNYAGGWRTSGFPSGVVSGRNTRAFFCTGTNAASVVIVNDLSPAVRQNFANWFSYYRTRSLTARSAMSTAFARIDPATRVAWQNFNDSNYRFNSGRQIRALDNASWRTNFFNWLHAPRFSGTTPMLAAFLRAGQYLENNRTANSLTNPYYDEKYGRELACRQSFHVLMTDGYGNQAASSSIGNYDTVGRAIADGRTLAGPAARVYYNKASGSETYVPGMADMAFYFWARDLRPDLDNIVPSHISDRSTGNIPGATGDDEIYFNWANDPATWQRMVNFTVTFGAGGTLPYAADTVRQIALDQRKWPAVTSGGTTIDDAWHAAVNSRGEFLSAGNPQELVNALAAIMDNISSRQAVTTTSASSFFFRSEEFDYSAMFDSSNWSGDVFALRTGTEVMGWGGSAAQQLDSRSHTSRRIFTWVPAGSTPGAGSQQPFQWGPLSNEQKALLNRNPATGTSDTLGEQRVRFLWGDRSTEQAGGGPFRDRSSRLGAIIGSNMLYVERPAGGYSARPGFPEGGSEYAQFVSDNRDRKPMIYVGANDGMLHAFDARTGEEVWAYVPNSVMRVLPRLTVPNFQFVPTVDGELSMVDAYDADNGRWRTVLLGTFGLGAQAVYAMDVTDPDNPGVLWEFSDEHDPQLGYNYKALEVARIQMSEDEFRWVALVPSGYNNSQDILATMRGLPNAESDANRSEDGAALFVIDLFDGSVIEKFDNLNGVEGLGPVRAGEYGTNYNVALAAAGDLNGDLWRFDLSLGNRGAALKIFDGSPGRPITSAPRIYPDNGRGLTYVFGTGKFLEDADREVDATYPRQALYGIFECLDPSRCDPLTVNDTHLIDQVMLQGADGELRLDKTRVVPADKRGWRLVIGNPAHHGGILLGERVIDSPVAEFTTGALIAHSYVPHNDPCQPEGFGVIYILNAYTGGFVFPGSPHQDGDDVHYEGDEASTPFPGTGSGTIGLIDTGVRPGNPGDPGTRPPTQDMNIRFNPNGCFIINGSETNLCVIPRRRGWREIPLE